MSEPMNDNDDVTGRKRGRPKGGHGPAVPWHRVYRLLVFGEVALNETTSRPEVRFPSYRELASRYGVSVSLIATYAAKHQCIKHRELLHAHVQGQPEHRLLEQGVAAPTMPIVEVIAILEEYRRALQEGAVLPEAQDAQPTHRLA
jgi:hypothetical protein